MRFTLATLVLLGILVTGHARADHIPVGTVANVTFACESSDTMVRLIMAKTEVEVEALLVGALCYTFGNGIPSEVIGYQGHAYDPISKTNMEVYEVRTIIGQHFFTYLAAPKREL